MTDNTLIEADTLIVKRGEDAIKRMYATYPKMRAQAARYVAAKAKLREGMRAMLDCYEAKNAEEDYLPDEADRLEYRDRLVAEVMNIKRLPMHYGIPENELSALAFLVLEEALESMALDDRTWKGIER